MLEVLCANSLAIAELGAMDPIGLVKRFMCGGCAGRRQVMFLLLSHFVEPLEQVKRKPSSSLFRPLFFAPPPQTTASSK